jgi:uncharacterized protein (TIGR02246 family)
MPASTHGADRTTIRDVLRTINDAWRRGRVEELGEYFHPEAVIVAPGFRKRAQGRDECMQSYKDFVAATKVTDYQESDMTVDIWGDTAVASYHYEIAWEVKGQPYRDSGRDVFVLRREGGKWLVVWRTLVPPAGQG